MFKGRRGLLAFGASLALLLGVAGPARSAEFLDGRIELYGSVESHFRVLNHDFRHEWDLSQWRNVLALELESMIIEAPPEHFPFIDDLSIFIRAEASYDCVWRRGCGMFPTADAYGNRAKGIPSRYRDAKRSGFAGDDPNLNPVNSQDPYHLTPPLSTIADSDDLLAGAPGKFLDVDEVRRKRTSRLIGIGDVPPFEILGENFSFNTAFKPLLDYRFAVKQDSETTSGGDASGVDATVLMWRPKDKVQGQGLLSTVKNVSDPPLDFRPSFNRAPASLIAVTKPLVDPERVFEATARRGPGGLFNPSAALRRLTSKHNIDRYDQNFDQSDLEWNFGANQDEYALREAYVDMNLFDARLFLRIGKQTIIWGKTELFRNQDQFNPSDLALLTLPNLEESRIPLWAMRAIYSFWNVGPLEDVRLEIAWMLDDFEPNDIGRCGEPYAPLPGCAKTFGVFQHGVLGAGLVGETRPPNWWEDMQGLEIGARLEFRWDRFSFAVSNFWHYEDAAVPRIFNRYQRRVDEETGRMLSALAPKDARCIDGTQKWCLKAGAEGPGNSFGFNPQNRQLFDVICASSVAFLALDPSVCALTITTSQNIPNTTIPASNPFVNPTIAGLLSATAAGNNSAAALFAGLIGVAPAVLPVYTDECDDRLWTCAQTGPVGPALLPAGAFSSTGILGGGNPALAEVLTDQQEALLGCGPFFRDPAQDGNNPGIWAGGPYSASCDVYGIDLFHAEASVLVQAWPGVRKGTAVATRWSGSGRESIVLPGARGPADDDYDPRVDGCVGDLGDLGFDEAAKDPNGVCNGRAIQTDPRTGEPFANELAIVSYNALQFVIALDFGEQLPDCDAFPVDASTATQGIGCPTLQDLLSVTQTTRPDRMAGGNGRFGRRDFAWAGAGEIVLEYDRVNTFGFAVDFSEDLTATNWGVEFTWTHDKEFVNSERFSLRSDSDLFGLTVSIDRPTFIRFLNRERTFFFNMQWFFEYIPDYDGRGPDDRHRGFAVDGPWTALGVFTLETGYFQDRLTPRATFVYDTRSESGAVVLSTRYRFSAQASVTIGMNHFYGPGDAYTLPIGLGALGESNQTYRTERFSRLNAVRERDELFLSLRYTF